MFVDDFVELNFSDRNFLNLRPHPDTNLAFHGVCREALTIPLKTAKRGPPLGLIQEEPEFGARRCEPQSFPHLKTSLRES
jgi:hypothetical protein